MSRWFRFPTVLLISATMLGLVPWSAVAAIWIRFEPRSAPPGATVRGTTLGGAMALIPSGRLSLFLVPSAVADTVESPEDPRLVPIGDLVADAREVGRVTFTVPNLSPGKYMTVAYCAECATGGTIFTVGPLKVEASGVMNEDQERSADDSLPILAVVAVLGALALLGLGLALRVRRVRTKSPSR